MMQRLSAAAAGRRASATSAGAAIAAAPASWKALHGLFDFEVPLTTPLPGFPESEPRSLPAGPAHAITALPNGLKVVSVDRGAQVSTMALFHARGARHAQPHALAVPAVLEKAAFAAGSTERSAAATVRAMENTGAAFHCAASREMMVYSAEALRSNVGPVARILAEAAAAPAVLKATESRAQWDVANAKLGQTRVEILEDSKKTDPETLLSEALHAVAFQGNTLGLPLVADKRKLSATDPSTVIDFIEGSVRCPSDFVLAAIDVDHDELVRIASDSVVGSMPAAASTGSAPAVYSGGETRIAADGLAQVALGFKGVSWTDADLVPAAVMHALLGGGGSFSSGGPGKGMYTRLYTRILVECPWVHSAQAFNHVYSDAGVFGITASAEPDQMSELVNVVSNEAAEMGTGLTAEEINRAKNQTISSLVMNLESRAVLCEDLGRQVSATGSYTSVNELVDRVQAVTKGDLEKLSERFLASKPSLVLRGEVESAPPVAQLAAASRLQLK